MAAPSEDDEEGGWLFDRLMGKDRSASQEQAPSGVRHASASEPLAPAPAESASASGTSSRGKEAEKSGFELSDLDPENIVKNVKKMAGYGPDEGLARTMFREGEALYHQKRFDEAAEKFAKAAARWPDSSLEEDALFFLGESQFFSDQYPKAHDTFKNLLDKYDNSRHLDTIVAREYDIGRYWKKLHDADPHWPVTPNLTDRTQPIFNTFGNALAAYESVRMHDPVGPLADDSLMATANAYFLKGRYEDAARHFDLLRTEYPRSKHQFQAHLLGIQSKERIHQGPLYDREPLEDAAEIAEQTLVQFPNQLGSKRGEVVDAANRINAKMALQDLEMAQFYEKKKEFGAARYYYRIVIEDYPQTPSARTARLRLEAIKQLPDKPPNRFKWLTDLFPAGE